MRGSIHQHGFGSVDQCPDGNTPQKQRFPVVTSINSGHPLNLSQLALIVKIGGWPELTWVEVGVSQLGSVI
jgi:hypothetical protein